MQGRDQHNFPNLLTVFHWLYSELRIVSGSKCNETTELVAIRDDKGERKRAVCTSMQKRLLVLFEYDSNSANTPSNVSNDFSVIVQLHNLYIGSTGVVLKIDIAGDSRIYQKCLYGHIKSIKYVVICSTQKSQPLSFLSVYNPVPGMTQLKYHKTKHMRHFINNGTFFQSSNKTPNKRFLFLSKSWNW